MPGFPAIVFNRTEPLKLAAAPFASGVPTVRFGETFCGDVQDPNDKGAPCVLFAALQAWYASTSEVRSGVAPLGRG